MPHEHSLRLRDGYEVVLGTPVEEYEEHCERRCECWTGVAKTKAIRRK